MAAIGNAISHVAGLTTWISYPSRQTRQGRKNRRVGVADQNDFAAVFHGISHRFH